MFKIYFFIKSRVADERGRALVCIFSIISSFDIYAVRPLEYPPYLQVCYTLERQLITANMKRRVNHFIY